MALAATLAYRSARAAAGGEAAAREAGRWRAQDLEETLVQAREAARAVTDEAAAATSAMPVIYE